MKSRLRGLTAPAFAPQGGVAARCEAKGHAQFEAVFVDPEAARRNGGGEREEAMVESVYKVIEIVGTSDKSWEDAARAAVERASKSLRDLRVAEVVEQDLVIENGKVEAYRTKLNVSFKYEDQD